MIMSNELSFLVWFRLCLPFSLRYKFPRACGVWRVRIGCVICHGVDLTHLGPHQDSYC